MSQSEAVRAIDVGFGNTKYVDRSLNGEVSCSLFPSLTPVAGPNDLNGNILQRRNTVAIDVKGVRYEVGRDSLIAQGGNSSRVLDPSFSRSDSYIALVRGALYYMGASSIENLIVGLPVSTYRDLHEGLAKTLTGVHPVPSCTPGGGSNFVTVHRVHALPQPMGAYFDHLHRANGYTHVGKQMSLVIDPGFFTLDWLLCHGIKAIEHRSGAHNSGVSSILRTITDAIGRDLKTQLTDLTEIDNAVRENRNPRYFGQEVDISKFKPLIMMKTREAVSSLAARVGVLDEIDTIIILAGGGAQLYKEAVQEKFPRHQIDVAHDPIFANVRGFQRAGETWIRNGKPSSMTR